MTDNDISIRSIQHYLYCPHRWGLIEIDCAWTENYYVTKSDIMHERVHETGTYSSRAKKVYTAVSVYNDLPEYRLYGVTDCLEFSSGLYRLVEYKPAKPKSCEYNHDDLMQVFAQKICTDYALKCDCEGYIYYSDVKKRIKLPLHEGYSEYDRELKELLAKMRDYRQRGVIPPIVKGQKCSGCSMKDICMPKLKNSKSLRDSVRELLEKKP